MDDALLCCVPAHDAALVEELLPGCRSTAEPLAPSLAHTHPDVRVLSVMIHDHLDPETLADFGRLEAVVTRSGGYDHLPLDWMQSHGVRGYHLGDYASQSVAELALMALIALARRVPEAMHATRAGAWDRSGLVAHRLTQRTVGIIGAGSIGGRLARMLADLGVDVVAHDIEERPELMQHGGIRWADDLTDLLEEADAISLHVPLDDTTRGMVGGDFLGRVRPGTILVNTARGALVDSHAVQEALAEGTLAGFAADVLPDEPDVPDLPVLKGDPRVLLTPHLGAHDHATIRSRYARTRHIIDAVLAGRADEVAAYRMV